MRSATLIHLRLAVWPDGYVIRSEVWSKPGTAFVAGWLPKGAIESLLEAMSNQGLLTNDDIDYTVQSGPYDMIAVRREGDWTRLRWDEIVEPLKGANIRATEEYREFACQWIKAKILMTTLTTPESVPLDDVLDEKRNVRGFDPAHPEKSAWLVKGMDAARGRGR